MRAQQLTTRLLVMTLLFGLLAGVPLASAPAAAGQDDQLQIVFSVPGLNFPFFVHMMNIARDKAAELDVELIEQDGQDDSATQSAGIESAIAQGVDGIVISPKDVEALAPAIQAAMDAGIPVVTVDRAVSGADTLGHVGADNVRGGEKQGEYLMEILPEGGQIIELQGSVGASPAIDRSAGFNSVIADHPEYEIVFQQTAEFDRAQGLTVTEQALQANPEVSAIVAANDDMAFGAAEAVAGAGLDVPIIGFDALPEALQAVQDGTLAATVEQFPGGQTSGAMEVLVNYLRDGTEPAEHTTLIEPALITAENVGEAERAEEAGIESTAAGATPEAAEATPAA
ncbi:MAG: rbsB [Thermomicrobiales bacterium]|jgi:ABC-type sugar transport system substrate-binding protein|nr:rbsB [Thermomicrobiales bacterium]